MTAEEMDRQYSPADMLLPVSCDSSQLEAVEEAVSGGSFIMFGPPGTGKSQTITNIIANALYRGKRVLFVAQKAAALEVVRTRLDKLGLSPFCLDVFSNKANKTQVLAQLNNCTQVTRYKSPADFEIDTKRLMELRREFNGVMDATHQKLSCGLSMYDAISQYIAMGDDIDGDIALPANLVATTNQAEVAAWMDTVGEAAVICKAAGNPIDNPLNILSPNDYNTDSASIIAGLCQKTIQTYSELGKSIAACNELIKVTDPDSKGRYIAYRQLLTDISSLTAMTAKVASFSDNDGKAPQYFQAIQHGKNASEIRAQILKNFKPEILNRDWSQLKLEWQQSIDKFFIMRYFAQRRIKGELAKYSTAGGNITDAGEVFNMIEKFNTENTEAERFKELNEIFDGVESNDWAIKEQMLRDVLNINSDIKQLSGSPIEYQQVKQNFAAMFAQGFTMFKDFYAQKFAQFATLASQSDSDNAQLSQTAGLAPNATAQNTGSNSLVDNRIIILQKIIDNIGRLKDWYIYLTVRRKAEGINLKFATDYFDQTNSNPDTWLPKFKKSFYKAVVEHVFATSPALQLFKGEIFDEKIKRYRELNDKYMELAKAEIYAKLASNAPDFSVEASKNSEPGILMKNIRSNGRGTSIRTIFDQLPNLLPRLCPCMLMSPMSVAQYLTLTDKPQFDLTIFDEASQMPTSDAVGAIARSRNVIITGDPKQMPPTSFFSSTQTDEENIEVEDLESILDDALALNIKSRNLLWHYRSKHESLITFSNHEY
ncbi:MAG: AAA family ATPase, partial [Bacteroidales bacterium]|nr:AAA family ATPase [Bacteroidales bacterium]